MTKKKNQTPKKTNINAAIVHYNKGISLSAKGDLKGAIESYQQAINLNPDFAGAYYNIGNAFYSIDDLDAAIENYKQMIKLMPDYASAYYNMGIALYDKGNFAGAILSYGEALKLKPNFAGALYNIGKAQQDKGELDAAIVSYKKAIHIEPNYVDAYYNMGNLHKDKGELDISIESYKQALKVKPNFSRARAQKLYQQAHICDWKSIQEDHELVPELGILGQAVSPFSMLSFEDSPKRHEMRSKKYIKEQNFPPALPLTFKKHQRIRIGYFSYDFHNHATMYLMIKLFESHNQKEFEIYAYSFGPNTADEMRQRVIKAVHVFHDVTNMDNREIALLAQRDEIDIAVDLKGFTKGNRLGIFAHRAAPIQINHLGYPGTIGADFIDYIIADKLVIPPMYEHYYSEHIIRLPYTYQPNDNTRVISDTPLTRFEMGLPEQGFVFCCFNNNYKISSEEFNIWMRVLGKVEGSVLWLIKANKWAVANLKKEAGKRGIDSNRLIFAEKIQLDKHLARHNLADLFIDTFNVNAHTTTSDALWAGLPVVTKLGKSFAARVAGSLLTAVDLPELIVETNKDYEALILALANNPEHLTVIKKKLMKNRISKPLFDTENFTKYLEDGYQQAYNLYLKGHDPANIDVSK